MRWYRSATSEDTAILVVSFLCGSVRAIVFIFDPSAGHYNDVMMSAMASQIISLTIVYSTVYSRRKGPVTRKMFPFDDVIMWLRNLAWFLNELGARGWLYDSINYQWPFCRCWLNLDYDWIYSYKEPHWYVYSLLLSLRPKTFLIKALCEVMTKVHNVKIMFHNMT